MKELSKSSVPVILQDCKYLCSELNPIILLFTDEEFLNKLLASFIKFFHYRFLIVLTVEALTYIHGSFSQVLKYCGMCGVLSAMILIGCFFLLGSDISCRIE